LNISLLRVVVAVAALLPLLGAEQVDLEPAPDFP
jgi:hypothetical protein